MKRKKTNYSFFFIFNYLLTNKFKKEEIFYIFKSLNSIVIDPITLHQNRNQSIDFSFNKIKKIVKQYKKNKPLPLILKRPIDFLNLKIMVKYGILIPRMETQELIEIVKTYIKSCHPKNIYDLCSGTGVIGLALKSSFTNINVYCNDIRYKSIKLIKHNAYLNNLNVNVVKKDCFNYLKKVKPEFIIMNPPYISKADISKQMLKYENKKNFYAKNNGLYFYQKFINNFIEFTNNDNFVAIFEIGFNQKNKLIEILNTSQLKNYYSFHNDINDNNRILIINYKNPNSIIRTKMYKKLKIINDKKNRDKQLINNLINDKSYLKKKYIGLYYPMANYEPDIKSFIKYLLNNHYHVCLPVIEKTNGFREITNINFAYIKKYTNLIQPNETNKLINIKKIKLFYVPCLGFNQLYRLGHGTNFYNTIFKNKKCQKILISYKEQENKFFLIKLNYQQFDKNISI